MTESSEFVATLVALAEAYADACLLLGFGIVMALAAWVGYRRLERRHRHRWQALPLPPVDVGGGAYRLTGTVPGHLHGAPAGVRFAAATSLFLGLLAVPGVLLVLLALAYHGLGAVGVPSLVVAVLLYRAGVSLLAREAPRAFARARFAALSALGLNVLLLASVSYALYVLQPVDTAGLAFVQACAAVSLAQATILLATAYGHRAALAGAGI